MTGRAHTEFKAGDLASGSDSDAAWLDHLLADPAVMRRFEALVDEGLKSGPGKSMTVEELLQEVHANLAARLSAG